MPKTPHPVQTEPHEEHEEEATFGLDEVIAALSTDLKKARKDAAAKGTWVKKYLDSTSEAPRLSFSSRFNETPKSGERAD